MDGSVHHAVCGRRVAVFDIGSTLVDGSRAYARRIRETVAGIAVPSDSFISRYLILNAAAVEVCMGFMDVQLVRAGIQEAEKLWRMQVQAFEDLYEKYRDDGTSPAKEGVEQVRMKLAQSFTYYYFIKAEGIVVGAIRVVDRHEPGRGKRIAPIFIMREYRNRGLAQEAIRLAEEIHGSSNWELDTILQEKGNCHLYEKLGYHRTGETRAINDRMTLVFYRKD